MGASLRTSESLGNHNKIVLVNPGSPGLKMLILFTVQCISYGTSTENLSKYQDILSLVITFFIPIT